MTTAPCPASTAIVPTRGQTLAIDAFFDFLLSDDRYFAISGTAGVGKTWLMGHVATSIMNQYRQSCTMLGLKPDYDSVVFTATTNKAAEVLENTLGKPVKTLHSFLNLKVQENYATGKTTLTRTKSWHTYERVILFIDECSMIDETLFHELDQAMVKCKIVFVGDHAQMAPVGEPRSMVYDVVPEKNLITLTEPVRNAGQPALVNLCAQLRETVETGIFRPIEPVDGAIYYLSDEELADGLNHVFKALDPSCRVLCYTNDRVQDFNCYIRETVRQRPAEPVPGDVMVVAQAYARGALNFSVETEVEITKVEEPTVYKTEIYTQPFEIEYRDVTVRKPGIGTHDGVTVKVASAEGAYVLQSAIKAAARRKDWSIYFDLKAMFLDMRHKAAATVYKAQGSTYDSVFVDLGNIGTSYDAAQVARMLFVAVSRAKTTVYFHGRLPGRYHDSKGKPLWDVNNLVRPSSKPSSPDLLMILTDGNSL